MDNCLFCRIISGDIPSTKVYEDDKTFAFRDINPQAPTHVLVVPKTHIASVDELTEENIDLAGKCLLVCKRIAAEQGLAGGYRIISNCGPDSGQTVDHLHFHVLGGERLTDRMG